MGLEAVTTLQQHVLSCITLHRGYTTVLLNAPCCMHMVYILISVDWDVQEARARGEHADESAKEDMDSWPHSEVCIILGC